MSARARLDVQCFRRDVAAFAAAEQAERQRLALPCRTQTEALQEQGRVGRSADQGRGAMMGLGHG